MLKKIEDSGTMWKDEGFCSHPEHEPPMHIVLENGKYRHTCPGCGKVKEFVVRNPIFNSKVVAL